jgi:hypothetical protein
MSITQSIPTMKIRNMLDEARNLSKTTRTQANDIDGVLFGPKEPHETDKLPSEPGFLGEIEHAVAVIIENLRFASDYQRVVLQKISPNQSKLEACVDTQERAPSSY